MLGRAPQTKETLPFFFFFEKIWIPINGTQQCCIGSLEINNLLRFDALAGQLFDEKMVAQEEVESKQLKVLIKKTKAMSKYA